MFLYYVLAQRLASKLPTALQLSLEEFMFFSENDCCVMKKWNISYYSNKPIWALSDSNEHIIIPHPKFFFRSFLCIQATSPIETRWKEWNKQHGGVRYCMRSWTWFELSVFSNIFQPTQDIVIMREMFDKYTSAARAYESGIDCGTLVQWEDDVQRAIKKFLDKGEFPDLSCRNVIFANISSKLFNLEPKSDEQRNIMESDFATKYIEYKIYEAGIKIQDEKTKVLFQKLNSIPNARGVAGYLYEQDVHQQLGHQGAEFDILNLNCTEVIKQFKRNFQRTDFVKFAELEAIGIHNRYFVPIIKNFATIDSFIVFEDSVFLFQITVSTSHSRISKGLDCVAKGLTEIGLGHLVPRYGNKKQWYLIAVIPEKVKNFKFLPDKASLDSRWTKHIIEGVLVLPCKSDYRRKYELESSRQNESSSISSASQYESEEVISTSTSATKRHRKKDP